jgi:DNA-binding SARP family transcriptional activator/tetratricopeptide (TPR) repeat protein
MSVPRRSRPARLLIVAAAGYGKSVTLESELPAGARRCSATEALVADLTGARAVGVDDVDALEPQQQVALVRRLGALSSEVGLVLASRSPLEPEARAALRGAVLERGPSDLALSQHAVARVLADEYGLQDPHLAERVYAATRGWPALVHLAADALGRQPMDDLLGSLTRPGSPTATWVADHVLPAVPGPVLAALGVVAGLGPVDQRLLDRVASARGGALPPASAAYLHRIGVLVPRRLAGRGQEDHVVPVVAGVLASVASLPADVRDESLRVAAAAYEEEGQWLAAARASRSRGDWGTVERLVASHGEAMVRAGEASSVVDLLGAGSEPRSEAVRLAYADALRLSGEPEAALRAMRPLVAAADADGWTQALATRVAAVHHTLDDYQDALDTLLRADPGADDPVDEEGVEWLSWRLRTLVMLGRRAEAQELADALRRAADRLATPRALAAAHLALARIADGTRKEAHHEQARRAAEAWGDTVTVALVLVNQSHLELAGARFADAAASSREYVRGAELGSPPGRLVAALHNLAEALTRMGEYDEAQWHLHRAVAHARRLGPGATAVGLLGLADVHRKLGHDERALAAYAEAVRLARESHERQVLVPALAGLARLTAATRPEDARAAAEEASALASPSLRPFSCLALGWVAWVRGDLDSARAAAAEAVESAQEVRAVDLLGEALELTAECAEDEEAAASALTRAHAIWRSGGAAPEAARIELLLGGLPQADAAARSRARDAARLLQRLGITHVNGRPVTSPRGPQPVRVRVLGGFEVTVDGVPVPLTAWRSRQARTLVKILAARRGRPVTRSHLCGLLWPDDDPAKTGHRLSVLLATVRGVLDPERRWPAEQYVASDLTGVWLDLRRAQVDALDLVRDADQAADLLARGDEERAGEILTDIDARYAGDAFDEEPDAEWADGLREEARAAWMRSVRLLVSARNRAGRGADSPALLVRLLAADPYDEQAHRLLVRALARSGRHGEAQRAFGRWADAMREIDAPLPEASAVGAVLTPR